MKQVMRFVCVAAVLCAAFWLIADSFRATRAQSTAPLFPVDEFIAQITASGGNSFVGGVSGDGRFVVIESTGDIATRDASRGLNPDNSDGNREVFLFDYAQRRIFQITNTRSALNPVATPSPTPTPSPSATPTPTPAPGNPSTFAIEVSNNRPVVSNDGRFIAFTSNASTPANFDGDSAASRTALAADGNQELFIYQIPAAPAADLASGAEPAFVNLGGGALTRITDTPASRLPTPGSTTRAPSVADDNRFPVLNDDGSVIAFTSTRNLAVTNGATNTDANPEIYLYSRLNNSFTQLTNTPFSQSPNSTYNPIFNENPSISGDGATVAFISNGNIPDVGASSGNNSDNNAEVYLARLNTPGGVALRIRQLTQTQATAPNISVNLFNPGRHLSRDGQFIAFESSAQLNSDSAIQSSTAIFVADVSNAAASGFTFTQVGPRATSGGDVLRFPTFSTETRADGSTFSTLIFTSALNFRSNGGTPDTTDPGLNPPASATAAALPQLFAAPVTTLVSTPSASLPANTFVRLTNFTSIGDVPQAYASNTRSRIVFSVSRTELGGGNADNSTEAFYLLTQPRPDAQATPSPSPGAVSYFTGASERPISPATASPTPVPSPVPTDAPASGLAPGMLAIARTAAGVTIGPDPGVRAETLCQVNSLCLSENRRPSLPIQLAGVSVSVGGAAAGLYFVSPNQINFVVPVGLAAGLYNVVINNNGALVRSQVRVVAAQPDLALSQTGTNRARATNVTNPNTMDGTPEPFSVTTTFTAADGQTRTDPTRLRFILTGVRNATDASITVRIGTTAITGDANIDVALTTTPGFDQLDVILPATLAGAGDVPVIVEVSLGGVVTTSRPAETAPRITIN